MFQIVTEAIQVDALTQNPQPDVGGVSLFIGRVRNVNQGKEVTSLEYECYPELAIKEGNRILEQAKDRFQVKTIHVQHRVGHLKIGDIAIAVVVCSKHRRSGEQACSWVVGKIKSRLPIWKKEHYCDQKPEWIYCPHDHSHHSHYLHHQPASSEKIKEEDFFSAQLNIPSLGKEGQGKIKQAQVTVVGVGGLGTVVLENIVRMGVGHITLIDDDKVSVSNLARQTLFTVNDISASKVTAAAQVLKQINPWVQLQVIEKRLDSDNHEPLLSDSQIVVDATDNFVAKFLIHDYCQRNKVDLIQASVFQFEGRLCNFFFKEQDSPCLRCLHPEIPAQVCGACSDTGILATTVSMFGTLQAQEVVKRILGKPNLPQGKMLIWDLEHLDSQTIEWHRNPDCPQCGEVVRAEENFETSQVEEGDIVIATADVVTDRFPIQIRLGNDDYRMMDWGGIIDKDKRYILVCQKGVRSSEMVRYLYRQGFQNVFSLKNGVSYSPL